MSSEWHWVFILNHESQLEKRRKKGESAQIDSINSWSYTPMQGHSVPQRLSDLLAPTANETPVTWGAHSLIKSSPRAPVPNP
jgi:hypothetical protein